MQLYCGESMHRAIMGGKEGHKAVGELWRNVFCLMVCPFWLRNTPKSLIIKCFFCSYLSCYFSHWGAGQRKAQGQTKAHRQECCDTVSTTDRLWWKSTVSNQCTCMVFHCANRTDVCAKYCGVWTKSNKSNRMNWGENIFYFCFFNSKDNKLKYYFG